LYLLDVLEFCCIARKYKTSCSVEVYTLGRDISSTRKESRPTLLKIPTAIGDSHSLHHVILQFSSRGSKQPGKFF
jgi:hypothetical protein